MGPLIFIFYFRNFLQLSCNDFLKSVQFDKKVLAISGTY